jgi:hypothetical protein
LWLWCLSAPNIKAFSKPGNKLALSLSYIRKKINMGFIKTLAIGAAVAYGINYVTKKGPDGKSIIDNLVDNAPEWADRAKKYGELTLEQIAVRTQNLRDNSRR